MNKLKMSTAQKNIEKSLRESILNKKNEMKTEYIYPDYISFYKDAYFHCYPMKSVDFDRYILITDKMIKNNISHETDEIKTNILKSIIKEHLEELKEIDSVYFSYVILN